MSHEALYRKYRPKTFAELLGQDAVNRTLLNALATKHLAHAYLFCGPRGTGKTSTARLLAKALNCETGGPEPCNRCNACLETGSGSSMDVIEIDAASNRGIDDIRALRDQVRFAAVGGRYKVYIIDEAHMLTTEAVNAFLKTLEEPPPQVVFVLATTEAHKVLPTVVSRCQRFDFQRIPTPVLLGRLQHVAQAEAIPVSPASLGAIAKRAAGGLRDGLTLLDQVASLSIDGAAVPDDLVLRVLGQVRDDSLLAMGEAVAAGDVVGLWQLTTDYLHAGYDPQTLVRELMQHVRNLMVMQVAPEQAGALDVPETLRDAMQAQASYFSQPDLLYCLELLNETAERMRRSSQDQIWLEAGLARLCQRQTIASMLDLQARIEALEAAMGQSPAPRMPAAASRPPARPMPPPAAPPAARPAVPAPPPAAVTAPAAAVAIEPVVPPAPAKTELPPPAPVTAKTEPPAPAPVAAMPVEPVPSAAMPEPVADPKPAETPSAPEPVAPASAPSAMDRSADADSLATEAATVAVPPPLPPDPPPAAPPMAAPAAEAPAPDPAGLGAIDQLWQQLLDAIMQRHPPSYAILREARVADVDLAAGRLTLAFASAAIKEQMENPKRLQLVEGGIKAIFGQPLKVKCIEQATPPPMPAEPMAASASAPAPSSASPSAPPPDRPAAAAARPAPPPDDDDDLVAEAAKIFKGKVLHQP